MKGFEQPQVVTAVDLAFGGDMKKLMPPYAEIPEQFKQHGNPYVRFQAKWFFSGITKAEVPAAKPGVDQDAAMRHLAAIQRSFEPKHEHKEAAVAYLASLWLEEPSL